MAVRSVVSVFLVALAVASILLSLLRVLLSRRNMLDHPNERSSHSIPTPRGAGVAQLFGILAGMLVGGGLPAGAFFGILGFTALGAVDDWRPRSATARLAGQMVLAVVVVALMVLRWPEGAAPSLGLIAVSWLLFPVAVNAANFMDGINGISAAHGIVLGAVYAVLLSDVGAGSWVLLGVALTGASVAFLPWNWRSTAAMFLGDSGSYLLGAAVALLTVAAWSHGINPAVAVAPFAVYLADVFSTLIRRAVGRKSLTSAHRDHAYQRLVILGWSHQGTSLFVGLLSATCGVLAIGAQREVIPLPVAFLLIAAVCVLYLWAPGALDRARGSATGGGGAG